MLAVEAKTTTLAGTSVVKVALCRSIPVADHE